jgi:hypothetical protein
MKIQSVKFGIIILIFIMIITNASAATVSFSPSTKTVTQGQIFEMNITIDPQGAAISGAQLNLLFNRSMIKVNSIREGNLFKQNGAGTFFKGGVIYDSIGIVENNFGVILGSKSVSTTGTFITINATAIGSTGKTVIALQKVIVCRPDGTPVVLSVMNGSIVVTSSIIDHTPPASIKSLKNATFAPYYIKWTWIDSTDPDFAKVMIYLNGKYITDVNKGIKYYNSTGLMQGTLYTLSTRTVDLSGNINSTWMNYSARTMSDKTPPASIKSLKNASFAPYYIKWTWTDPADPDLSKVMIYLNGKYITSAGKGIQAYNATGLLAGTLYTLSTRTVDLGGNINSTWVNYSARTMSDKMSDKTPPASIKSLKNATFAPYYIKWTWTDPADPDLSKVMIYLNGKYLTDVNKGIKYYISTGLMQGTLYTLSTRTVDLSGNINSTWVNYSARTMSDKTPPASIKSLKNATFAPYYIKWYWIDPADSDLSKVMIYLNGKYLTSAGKGVQAYNATGLLAGTLYTLSTRTVDIGGNINNTWVNHSAMTKK